MSTTRIRRRAASQTEHDAEHQKPIAQALALLAEVLAPFLLPHLSTRRDDERYYDTASLPPDIARQKHPERTFNETCRFRAVADARKIGRTWTCSRSAWEAARRSTRTPPPRLTLVPDLDPAELAAETLRTIRSGRRSRP